jgi:hypothetical protein
MKLKNLILMTAALIGLAACGGGGGGSVSGVTQPGTGTALVSLGTTGSVPAGGAIGGIDVTLSLPTGVTVPADPSPLNPAVLVPSAGVVTLKGGAAATASQTLLSSTYQPAASGNPGTVTVRLVSAAGFAPGDVFATVNCNLGGSTPVPADFSVKPNLAPSGVVDLNGAVLGSVSVNLSVAFN